MENAEMQRLRYQADKFNLKIRRANDGYRFYSEGYPVASVDGLNCNFKMTFAAVKKFIEDLVAARKQTAIKKVPAVNL